MSSDDLPSDEKRPEIVDPHNVPIVFVDWIVTGGSHENVTNVVLGATDHTFAHGPDDLARIVVAARLRFSDETGLRLYRALGSLYGIAPPAPPEQEPPTPKPPKNLIN
jgi:hypothetical protein